MMRRARTSSLFAFALWAGACQHHAAPDSATLPASRPAPPDPSRRGKLTLEIRVMDKGGKERTIQNGATVRSGERMALLAYVSQRPAYLYVLYRGHDRQAQQLFPEVGDNVLVEPSDQPRRIPDAPRWIKMDEQIGQEDFILLARDLPISRPEIDGLIAQAAAPPPTTAPAPTKPAPAPAPHDARPRPARKPHPTPKPAAEADLLGPGDLTRGLSVESGMEVPLRAGATATLLFSVQHR